MIAVVGHNLLPGMQGSGMSTTLSLNWMVLLHRMVTSVPQEKNRKSVLVSCLDGSNFLADIGSRWDFRNRP